MHRPETIREVQALAEQGLGASAIARAAGVPRSTVRDWIAGQVPRKSQQTAGASCSVCGHAAHVPGALPQGDYSYLFGMYLGDGCISRGRRDVYTLRIACDMHYPAIIRETSAAMTSVMPSNRVSVSWRLGGGWGAEIHSSSKAWPCLFPQHGPGPKHKRLIALEPWQERIVDAEPEQFVRGLIHSDGCRVMNRVYGREYPRYFFCQVSDDIRGLFCRSLTQLGVHYTHNDSRNVSIARRADVARLDEFVGPKF